MSLENKSKCPHINPVQEKLAQHSEYNTIVSNDDLNSDGITTSLQNLWHKKGYNGCIFSQVIAQSPSEFDWQASVVHNLNDNSGREIDILVNQAIENPAIRLLSIIFPSVLTDEDLTKLVEILSYETTSILLLNDESLNDFVALAFRVALENDEVLAWVMGFGPHESFAKTRQSPYTEIVIPVKPKPDDTYHRHNNDKRSAHVADQHIDLDDKVMDRLWENTYKKTRKVLGHEPDLFSGARTTFTIPENDWVKIKR
ncbi:hypothetical protein KC660_03340 [Candidatus Dojkabacteria bacterium]|uniref:Uncharacterized protein n=1 Tax=Candidatus Dojkabacteria bacterium TaxID=2099670 RepID=A0A955L4D9_9BACT|nr:hypothetical protein [Candidatus Dojkabacteria bacterium]